MKIRTILTGTAIATLALFTGIGMPSGTPMVPRAEAAVSISFSVFYDELEPHGDWVRHGGAYVFIPANVGRDWRPYTRGRWVHTERYGWTWISSEPFGWATYHYGRWGYDQEIGWYWRPGYRWAPAWVSWRRGPDYIVWAPLPPSGRDDDVDVSISITVGDIPDFYWVAVPARRFLSADIHVVVVDDGPEIRRVIERTEFVGAPRVTNNIVVNNVIDVDVVAEITGQEVKTVEVRETDDPRQASASGDQLTVFRADVAPDQQAQPKEVKDVSEVKKVKRGGEEGEAAGTQPIPEPDAGTGTAAEQPPAKAEGDPAETGGQQPAQKQAEEQPAQEQPGRKPAQQQAEEEPAQGQPGQKPAQRQAEEEPAQGQSGQKPAQRQAEEEPAQGQSGQQPAQEQAGEQQEPDDEATGSTVAPQPQEEEAQGQGRAKDDKQNRGQEKKECDPATDPNCQPAQ